MAKVTPGGRNNLTFPQDLEPQDLESQDLETQGDPLRIVALGGGTGLSCLLQGLKRFTVPRHDPRIHGPFVDLCAIVTVSDDGGSSGRLRRAFDILAPGDIRNCMVALAEDEALLSKLFQFRFDSGKGLEGHSFGNLFLTALTEVTGDFHQAIQLSSEVLAIRGRIFPSTLAKVRLEARLESGRLVKGETRISRANARIAGVKLSPRRCAPVPEALAALAEADLITLGPGSLYTSVIPNVLVDGIPKALAESEAPKAWISNLMWQPGETEGYSASDHIRAIHEHAGLPLIDTVVLNRHRFPANMKKRYLEQNARPVEQDDELVELGIDVVTEDLLASGTVARHDPDRLARVLVGLARRGRIRRTQEERKVRVRSRGGSALGGRTFPAGRAG